MARKLPVLICIASLVFLSTCAFAEPTGEDAFIANVEGFLSIMHNKLEMCSSVLEELEADGKIPTAAYETAAKMRAKLGDKHADIGYRLEEYRKEPLPYRHDWILEDMEWFSEGIFMLGFELEYWANRKVGI